MTLRTDILLAISQVHSGNREEGGRIVDIFRTWLAENGLAVVPREITGDMADAMECEFSTEGQWQAALAAAPDALRAEGESS
jgi:hypothetical protein